MFSVEEKPPPPPGHNVVDILAQKNTTNDNKKNNIQHHLMNASLSCNILWWLTEGFDRDTGRRRCDRILLLVSKVGHHHGPRSEPANPLLLFCCLCIYTPSLPLKVPAWRKKIVALLFLEELKVFVFVFSAIGKSSKSDWQLFLGLGTHLSACAKITNQHLHLLAPPKKRISTFKSHCSTHNLLTTLPSGLFLYRPVANFLQNCCTKYMCLHILPWVSSSS